MNIPTYPKKVEGAAGNPPWRWAGTDAPSGASDPFHVAPLGSEYTCVASGSVARYLKTVNNRADADWKTIALWTGSTWAEDGSGYLYATPSLGPELLTNGNMETGTPPSNWTLTSSSILTASTERTGGSGTRSLNVERGSADYSALQAHSLNDGEWVKLDYWYRCLTSTSAAMLINSGSMMTFAGVATTWTQKTLTGRKTGTGSGQYRLHVVGSTGNQAEFDDLSAKLIVPASLFATFQSTSAGTRVGARIVTLETGEQAGVVSRLDSATNPRNYVIAVHDGLSIRFTKCVAGICTSLETTTVTYVSDALIEIVWVTNTTCEAWYNGSKVGSTQTVSDAGIISNARYGLISTSALNKLRQPTFNSVVIPFFLAR